jgi:acid phosphatase (class A)
MKAIRVSACAAVLGLCLCVSLAHAQGSAYIAKDSVNLLILLAPPPGPSDPRTIAELDELRQMRATGSEARVALAKADVEESVFRLMTVFYRPLTPAQLPLATAFFQKLTADGAVAVSRAKAGFGRPRPYALDKNLDPVCPLDSVANRSYPSGHTSVGYLMGVVLAAMVPEKKEVIFARTQEYAESRLYCGVHYRTDIEAGRIAGTVLAAVAMNNAEFQREFAAARAELRAALGY